MALHFRYLREDRHRVSPSLAEPNRRPHPIYLGLNENDYSDLYSALCLTGMRIGEACHLTWTDVDLTNKIVLIRPGVKNGIFWQPKSTAGNRRIPIVPELESILRRQRTTNRNNRWVFETKRGTQLQPCNVQKRFRGICDGLKFEKWYSVHGLRKYWASTVAMQGMDAKVMIKVFGQGILNSSSRPTMPRIMIPG